ncbi:hypothetical protein AP060_00179 [Pseudomonas sp. TAD18]|nr:hypothetical protein AP060_00179 [Pseudomonas sp. TAD18]KVV11837.1 hypothetical protein AP059_00131 [Pseudomonas sp. TAA207]
MDDAHGAPADVQVFARVVGQVEGFARLQTGVVTLDLGDAGIAAQGVQAGLGEGLARDVALVAAGIIEAFVLAALVFELGAGGDVFLVVARVGKGVVALHLAGGAHLFGVVEAVQRRFRLIAASHGLVQHVAGVFGLDSADGADAVGDNQTMAVGAVFEGVEQAFFGRQPGDELKVGFTGLDAVFAGLVVVTEALFDVVQAMGLEHGVEDLRHRLLLEDPPVGTQPGAG